MARQGKKVSWVMTDPPWALIIENKIEKSNPIIVSKGSPVEVRWTESFVESKKRKDLEEHDLEIKKQRLG